MNDAAKTYWNGCASGRIRFQICSACHHVNNYPRPFCASCGSTDPKWHDSAGAGWVYAIAEITRAPSPDFTALVPYTIVLVTLDEGFRIMTHGRGTLGCDDRVRIEFAEVAGRALPVAVADVTASALD